MTTTIRELYAFAFDNKLLDAPIRICDGMAVSYYPTIQCVERGRYEIIIDVSTIEPVEYDELPETSKPIYVRDSDIAEIDALFKPLKQ